MPQRPRQHRIEPKSRRAFEEALGDRFVFREEPEDYGVDLNVEEFEATGEQAATGLRFHVQLKATDEQDLSKSLGLSLELDKAAYYRSLTLPVLMVRYRACDDTLYARWFHQYDPYYGGMGEKTMTFRWKPEDRFDGATPARLVEEARAFLRLRRSADLPTPVQLYLDVKPDGAYGLGPTILLFALRNAAEARADVVSIEGGPAPAAAMCIIARDNLLSVNLSEVTTATVHLANYDPGEFGEQFAIDAMVMTALAFEHVGRADVTSRLATGFLEKSTLVGAPEVAWGLSSAMARTRRVREALRLADVLDASTDAERRAMSMPFLLVAVWHGRSLDDDELADVEGVIEARITQRAESGNETEAGRESYNLGELLRRHGDREKALSSYDRAVVLDPGYDQRAYFHKERAGLLFLTQQYGAAADAYGQALEIEKDASTSALRADALMFSGRYAEARAGFAKHNATASDDAHAEWRLKELFLSVLVDRLALADQAREVERGRDAALGVRVDNGAAGNAIRELEEILQVDALCAEAWFSLGRANLAAENVEPAIIGYLGAALCRPEAAAAWVLTAMLAARTQGAHAVADDALVCGAFFTGAEFRRELVRYTQANAQDDPEYPAEAMLTGIDERLQELERDAEGGMLVRHLDMDGTIREIVLGAAKSE